MTYLIYDYENFMIIGFYDTLEELSEDFEQLYQYNKFKYITEFKKNEKMLGKYELNFDEYLIYSELSMQNFDSSDFNFEESDDEESDDEVLNIYNLIQKILPYINTYQPCTGGIFKHPIGYLNNLKNKNFHLDDFYNFGYYIYEIIDNELYTYNQYKLENVKVSNYIINDVFYNKNYDYILMQHGNDLSIESCKYVNDINNFIKQIKCCGDCTNRKKLNKKFKKKFSLYKKKLKKINETEICEKNYNIIKNMLYSTAELSIYYPQLNFQKINDPKSEFNQYKSNIKLKTQLHKELSIKMANPKYYAFTQPDFDNDHPLFNLSPNELQKVYEEGYKEMKQSLEKIKTTLVA